MFEILKAMFQNYWKICSMDAFWHIEIFSDRIVCYCLTEYFIFQLVIVHLAYVMMQLANVCALLVSLVKIVTYVCQIPLDLIDLLVVKWVPRNKKITGYIRAVNYDTIMLSIGLQLYDLMFIYFLQLLFRCFIIYLKRLLQIDIFWTFNMKGEYVSTLKSNIGLHYNTKIWQTILLKVID